MTGYCPAGLPHSEIPGSMDICSSPRLIAACHVLLRLLMPRHSPCALSSLTCSSQSPLGSVSAFRENSARSLAPRFSPKTRFRRMGDGSHGLCFELSENSWFSLRIMQAYKDSKLYVTLHPFGCCSTINLLAMRFHMTPLCCLTCLCHIVQFSRCRSPASFEVRSERSDFPQVFRSKGKSPGGPEWARTTDLTIISRTL